jgi:superfamily II RNA helicase
MAPQQVSLADRLPPRPGSSPEALLDLLLSYFRASGLSLYAAQEQAILELLTGNNVILATPTGSGKSLVALAFHFLALADGKRSFYTAPIKALVSEKFFSLCRDFGPDRVGMITGDGAVNADAPIICCTAEIVASMALREGRNAPIDALVIDEFHYYADRERGVAWQVPLLVLERAQFLLMSATMGPSEAFEKALTRLTKRTTSTVRSSERPVPLSFEYRETPLQETVLDLLRTGRTPAYVVNFTQRAAAETAQDLMSVDLCTKGQKKEIATALADVRFDTPYGKEVKRLLAHGIGLHHAGLLPKYRLLIEKMAQKGRLAIISGTDTLGVGVNIPMRTVVFTRLCKFDGEKTALLQAREFQQIAGRAGRKGFDDHGFVIVQAPEHAIENARLAQKAAGDPLKLKRIVRKKPPDRGYVHWDRAVFDRLVSASPEPLVSRFRVSHGMILSVLQRPDAGLLDLARVIHRSHERRAQRRIFGREAKVLFESLVGAGIVEADVASRRVRLHVDLQDDFTLHRALSLWLVAALEALDRESGTYALDVLTLVESILEDPDAVLRQQLEALKRAKLAELKMAGVEYDERVSELEKLEHPKPLREFVYESFNAFAREHPWAREDNVRPKSVAREMVERFMDFNEYVREYELGRSEGTLLRYLTDAYRVLAQTVPAATKTPAVEEIEVFLRATVRSVDSSLIDEWERMRAPIDPSKGPSEPAEPTPLLLTSDERAFTVLIRGALFRLVRALAQQDWNAAASMVSGLGDEEGWSAQRFARELEPFFQEHSAIRLDPTSRSPQNTRVTAKRLDVWEVSQVLCDPEEDNDWMLSCMVDLEASNRDGRPVVAMLTVSR